MTLRTLLRAAPVVTALALSACSCSPRSSAPKKEGPVVARVGSDVITADVAVMSRTLGVSMKKEGYDPPFVAAIIAAASTIAALVPPSITAVVYGAVGNVSIAAWAAVLTVTPSIPSTNS